MVRARRAGTWERLLGRGFLATAQLSRLQRDQFAVFASPRRCARSPRTASRSPRVPGIINTPITTAPPCAAARTPESAPALVELYRRRNYGPEARGEEHPQGDRAPAARSRPSARGVGINLMKRLAPASRRA